MNTQVRVRNIVEGLAQANGISGLYNDDKIMESINSITFIQLVVAIEAEFDIEFPDEDLDFSKYKSFSDLVDKIESIVDKKAVEGSV